jgi:AGZA family xanthine/uracil permease-like MFS transporter
MYAEKSNPNNNKSFLDRFFGLSQSGTNVKTEIIAGITTFVTMGYIIFVNPNILRMSGMNSAGALGDKAVAFTALNDPVVASVFTATCISAAIGCILIGLIANLPFGLAPGMGLNAFFTFTIVLTMGYTWQQGLAAVFISGVMFLILAVTGLIDVITNALPKNLKFAISGGIGLFIALIGLKSGGVIVSNPATLVGFGNFHDKGVLLTIIGVVITAFLMARNVTGSILIGIILTTIIGIPMGVTNLTGFKIFSAPPSIAPTLFQFNFPALLEGKGGSAGAALIGLVMVIITITLVDTFDTIGTFVGTATKAGLVDEKGQVKNMRKGILACSFAVMAGATLGTSTVNAYVETNAGVAVGGRTGLTSVVIGILFILALFFGGIVGVVPAQATAPALIIVGVLMLGALGEIDFSDFTEAVPVFFTVAIMPFSYSIANGISIGLIFYPLMKLITGRHKEVHPVVYILAVLFVIRFLLLPSE